MDIPSTAGRGTRSRVLQTLGINFTRMGGSGTGGGRNRSSGAKLYQLGHGLLAL